MGVKIRFSICFVLTMFAMVNFKMSMSNLVNHQIFFSVSYKITFGTIILFSIFVLASVKISFLKGF